MMHVPGSLQETSYLRRSVQGAGATPRHSYSITESDGPRLEGALGVWPGMGVPGVTGQEE